MPVALDTLIDRSVRNMGAVNPRVKEYAIELIKRAYKEGIYVQISSGYRSFTEQAKLYGQGRSSYVYNGRQYGNPSKQRVTNAKPGQSIHNFGLAIDYFLVSDDGNDAIWSVNSQWRRVAAIAKSMGFEWGGDWTSFKDYPHLQMTKGLSLSQIRAGKRPYIPPITPKTWLEEGDRGDDVKELQEKLNSIGIDAGTADGIFGQKTKSAVILFQKRKELAPDGLAGKNTMAALNELIDERKEEEQSIEETQKATAAEKEEEIVEEYKKDAQAPASLLKGQEWAKETGISDGTYPDRPATRAELWEMLRRFEEHLNN